MNPLNQGHLSVGRSPARREQQNVLEEMPSWSRSTLWELNMPGVRHECTPLTAVPNQGVGSIYLGVCICLLSYFMCASLGTVPDNFTNNLSVSACSHPFLFLSGLRFPSRKRSSFLSAVSRKPALTLCSISTQVLVCGPFHWQQDEKIKNKRKVYH